MPGALTSSKLVSGSRTASELVASDPFTLALNSGETGFGFHPVANRNSDDDDDDHNDDDHDDDDDNDRDDDDDDDDDDRDDR